jgi:uncharacterized protein YfaT (DUF1175 family)
MLCFIFTTAFQAWSQEDFKVIFDDELPAKKESVVAKKEVVKKEVVKKDTLGIDAIIERDSPVASKNCILVNKDTSAYTGLDSLRFLIVKNANKYLGVRYHYGQSNANGFDCSGFVRYVYGNCGYTLPHSSLAQYQMSKHVKAAKALPGDLVFFRTHGRHVSHVGIYLGDSTFIHSPSTGKTVSVDSLNAAYYKNRLVGFGKVL